MTPQASAVREIYLPDIVGGGYKDFWEFRGRYRVVKGSRGSKKSKTAALNLMHNLNKYPDSNLIVVRQTYSTLKDSCFTELKWAMEALGMPPGLWRQTLHPLELTNVVTGQKILFRGLDNAYKVTSVAVPRGALCWMWIEEAFEIEREKDFDILNESLRGRLPEGLWRQVTLTFNPWDQSHWMKKRFFDNPSPDVLAKTTTYKCNEFLDPDDLQLFEEMKMRNPMRYEVAGLGNWGISEGLIYENWREERFDVEALAKLPGMRPCYGLDFGFSVDPTAMTMGIYDENNKRYYIYDEMHGMMASNERIYDAICEAGIDQEEIVADCAEPKSISRIRELGVPRIKRCRKGPDSVRAGIQRVQDIDIVIHPRCKNHLREIRAYRWEEAKDGSLLTKPHGKDDHLMDSMRYSLETVFRPQRFSWE